MAIFKFKNLYWFVLLYGIASFAVTRNPDGRLVLFFIIFPAITIAYLTAMIFCIKTKYTIHTLGHFLLFTVLSITPFMLTPKLDEMAGLLYLMIPGAIIISVVLGAVAIFIKSSYEKEK